MFPVVLFKELVGSISTRGTLEALGPENEKARSPDTVRSLCRIIIIIIIIIIVAPPSRLSEDEWGDLERLCKACQADITDSQRLA